ncbi:ARM repeat-containing protein [Hygrophoropsis aurantiaca]|uniref:ARM repeat-containing protein n=1 Tax=Hygrophoropsis aurantiaca TaxID=72124 RepID=A0ACB8ATW7_9AGAM|nr:ARM repeat-containing protein [Hygrophoropsis aurantiaca]
MNRIPKKLGPVVENVSPEEVYNVITGASSQDPALVDASSKRLKELLECFGTYDALHEIAAQKSVPLHVRQQSIIQFKNAALSHWKSRKLLDNDHRNRVRIRCMSFFDEQDDTIAKFNEEIVGKIARVDFPSAWPSLLTDIMQLIEVHIQQLGNGGAEDARASLVLRRSLKVLNSILKEFAGIKMLAGMGTMLNIVKELHNVIFTYYAQLSTIITSISPSDLHNQRTLDNLTVAHLVFKNLVTMGTWLWGRMTKDEKGEAGKLYPWFEQLFQSSAVQLKTLSELRVGLLLALQSSPAPSPLTAKSVDQLTRHVRLFGKFFRRLQQLEPGKFVQLPTCNDLVLYYWSKVVQASTNEQSNYIQDSPTAVFPVRFLVQAMVLFKDNLAKWTPFRKGGAPSETSIEYFWSHPQTTDIWSSALSQQFVEDAVKLLITRFIPLNSGDLKGWITSPEDWVNEEDKETEQWEFELRPCGERVLMTLSIQYKDYVTPLLETSFKQILALPTTDLDSVIQKEALYCAIGRCAPRLQEVIPFNEWLSHSLVHEARDTNPNFPIIKRRIAWLIGKWVGDMCSPASDPNIWEVLIHLLRDRGPGTDSVVRLTAATAIRECVDTNDFDADVFAPYLHTATTELVRLITEADATEIKRGLARSLGIVIERVSTRIVPHASMIAAAIPDLWTDAGQEWLFKASLLVLVSSLVSATQEKSVTLNSLVVPLVRDSLTGEAISNLDEDAFALWMSALKNTPTLQNAPGQPALIDLLPTVLHFLANNLDLLGKTTALIESYFLVDASLVLQHFSRELLRSFLAALTKQEIIINTKSMLVTLNFMIQLAPASLWGEQMHLSGIFSHFLNVLANDESATIILTEIIHLLARIALADCQLFLQLVSASAQAKTVSESSLYEVILDHWWRQFDHMSEPRHRKLVALGMASLVSTGRPEVLDRIPNEIANLWLDVLYEIKESLNTPGDSTSPLQRHWDLNAVPASYFNESEGSPEYNRRKAVLDRDPVQTLQLSVAITGSLQQAEVICGGPHVFQALYLNKLDPTVLKQLQTELQR